MESEAISDRDMFSTAGGMEKKREWSRDGEMKDDESARGNDVQEMNGARTVIRLAGEWEVEESRDEEPPVRYGHRVMVPGLIDMARPGFEEVGRASERRRYFWHRKTVTGPKEVPGHAILKVHKAMYGAAVWMNGRKLGETVASFTPTYWDVREHLRAGAENEVVIRVGADRGAVPEGVPAGWDFEKSLYVPGVYDEVEMILCEGPRIVNVQAVPDVGGERVRFLVEVESARGAEVAAKVRVEVAEGESGRVEGECAVEGVWKDGRAVLDMTLPLPGAKLWSPEEPFLYVARVRTEGDEVEVRFGMREFRFKRETGRAVLNGRERYLTGTNVTIHRFFEDGARGNLPWDREWVRKLHRSFKAMNWQIVRYCIGFPPEFWYDIADEEGVLIQDEFPVWAGESDAHEKLDAERLAEQYGDWMRERRNHPCVVIWDAQNESEITSSSKALAAVRHLDRSNRPWENGYAEPQSACDCVESHPYLFIRGYKEKSEKPFRLAELKEVREPLLRKRQRVHGVPVLINEYDWMWLNRDGTPTTLSRHNYEEALGENATVEERREYHGRVVAALTEYWRCHRKAAGVMHFCALGYSRGDGQTSDDFLDVGRLEYEPKFLRYVGDAFHPVGLMVDYWEERVAAGEEIEVEVVVINDGAESWKGKVEAGWRNEEASAWEECAVEPNGRESVKLKVKAPAKGGRATLVGALVAGGKRIESLRDVEVG